ncbi:lactonase family protein [Arachidicoccus sp.]|jgi:6-phosphogluconolactonase|uniref:lactonase family protein n=1 Tax=Arachidicoccus sp. TaxID=1872624 RepID=UPI003D1E075C
MQKIISFASCLSLAAILLSSCQSQKMKSNSCFLLAGTYTANNSSDGIYVYDFNEDSGTLKLVSQTEKVANPSYLAFSKDYQHLYAVNENLEDSIPGMVSAFDFNRQNGKLTFLNSVPSNGSAPCFVTVDASGKNVLEANYNGGNFSIFKTDSVGKLLPAVQIISQTGKSVNKYRQTQPHVHSTFLSPDEKYVFVCDLGNDTLYQYPFDANSPKPVDVDGAKKYKVPDGHGPRHIVFSPDKKNLYLLNELDGKLMVFKMENDSLQYLQTVVSTDVPDTVLHDKSSAAIRISTNGKFLYTSNRGNASDITIFSVNYDGTLKEVGHQPTDEIPRDINIDPSGKFLLVASKAKNNIKVYAIDQQAGTLTYTGHSVDLPTPVAVLFASKK